MTRPDRVDDRGASSSRAIRWSGASLLASGVLFFGLAVWHPDILSTGFLPALHAPLWPWVLAHLLAVVAMVFTLFGVIGLYAGQRPQIGALGLAGLVIAVPGIVLVACAAYFEAVAFPVLAVEAPGLLEFDGPLLSSPTLLSTVSVGAGYPIGLMLLGIATWRAGVLPRAAAAVFTVATPAVAVFEGLFVPVLGVASAAAFAVGSGWLGWALSRRVGTPLP